MSLGSQVRSGPRSDLESWQDVLAALSCLHKLRQSSLVHKGVELKETGQWLELHDDLVSTHKHPPGSCWHVKATEVHWYRWDTSDTQDMSVSSKVRLPVPSCPRRRCPPSPFLSQKDVCPSCPALSQEDVSSSCPALSPPILSCSGRLSPLQDRVAITHRPQTWLP